MSFLLDTHLILWTSFKSRNLSEKARDLLDSNRSGLCFSVASLWEAAIKFALGRPDFRVDPRVLRRGLLDSGYLELPVRAEHALATVSLPPIHKDPFDRMLVAQATAEGIVLLTADPIVARYPGPIRLV